MVMQWIKNEKEIIRVSRTFSLKKLVACIGGAFDGAPTSFIWAVPLLSFKKSKKGKEGKSDRLRIHLPLRL